MLLRYLCLKYLVSYHLTPISRSMFSLAALLNINGTDLNALNFSNKNVFEGIVEAQNLINA